MRIGVLGTGMVGRVLAARAAEVGHEVVIGTRDPAVTLARSGPDAYARWQERHPGIGLVRAPEATADVDLAINATAGVASVSALRGAELARRAGLVLLDVANPLEFRPDGMPTLSVQGEDSLAEQIQRAFPDVRVVKSLNTMNCLVMADPARVPGEHVVFVAGDDPQARSVVTGLLAQFGWHPGSVIDLGGLVAARATEMFLPLWLSVAGAVGSNDFNIALMRR